MLLQVLASSMNKNKNELIKKMNLQSNAIIINQTNYNSYEECIYNNSLIKFYSFSERGVGLSRNNALMRATADFCLIADEDISYEDNYENTVLKAFQENPKADIILFNVPSKNIKRPSYKIQKRSKVKIYNCLKYGAVRIAFRTERVKEANVYFSLLFGGGAKYSSGEDSLFLAECIRKGLNVYTNPSIIGYVDQNDSTWFEGYTEKFFIDKGIFYSCLSKRWAALLCLQFVIRHGKIFKNERNRMEVYYLMLKGVRKMKNKV